jgi:hypothetical protein
VGKNRHGGGMGTRHAGYRNSERLRLSLALALSLKKEGMLAITGPAC